MPFEGQWDLHFDFTNNIVDSSLRLEAAALGDALSAKGICFRTTTTTIPTYLV
jgi:hypothetical protein